MEKPHSSHLLPKQKLEGNYFKTFSKHIQDLQFLCHGIGYSKYSDYYYGTKRFNYSFATSIEEALEMEGEPIPECDLEQLLQAFPYDLFKA